MKALDQSLTPSERLADLVVQAQAGPYDTDEDWIHLIARGDRTAFERLYRAYQNRLLSYLLRMLRSREAAEEAFNDVMHVVWKDASKFRGSSKVSTWIFGIARYKALSRLGKRELSTVDDPEEAVALVDEGQNPEGTVISRDLIKRALECLSPEHREVIELTFYSGLSYQQIAEIMKCPVNTVKTRMFYARQHLQKLGGRLA